MRVGPARRVPCLESWSLPSGGTGRNSPGADSWLRAIPPLRSNGLLVSAIASTSRCWRGGFPTQRKKTSDRHDRRNRFRLFGSGPPGARFAPTRPSRAGAVMLANNETGAVHPVAEAAEIGPCRGRLLQVDGDPGAWKNSVDINALIQI